MAEERSQGFRHDRAMSLYRRAMGCRSEEDWEELAPKLGVNDPSTISSIWRTALSARAAGMNAKQAFPLQLDIHGMAESAAQFYLGEAVFTNERVLNYVLTNAGNIINRKDIGALDKFETLFAYLLKARREALGEVDV
jgi:hypothetical protein